jgi:hypothetical protein
MGQAVQVKCHGGAGPCSGRAGQRQGRAETGLWPGCVRARQRPGRAKAGRAGKGRCRSGKRRVGQRPRCAGSGVWGSRHARRVAGQLLGQADAGLAQDRDWIVLSLHWPDKAWAVWARQGAGRGRQGRSQDERGSGSTVAWPYMGQTVQWPSREEAGLGRGRAGQRPAGLRPSRA